MFEFETEVLTGTQKTKFVKFLISEIGTDYEVNKVEKNEYYSMVFDLELDKEYKKIERFQKELKNENM